GTAGGPAAHTGGLGRGTVPRSIVRGGRAPRLIAARSTLRSKFRSAAVSTTVAIGIATTACPRTTPAIVEVRRRLDSRKNAPTATMMLGMMIGDRISRYASVPIRDGQRETATAAGAARARASPAVRTPISTRCHVASSHPDAVKYFAYHWSEKPGGGNTKKAAELNDSGTIRTTGTTRNTSTAPPTAVNTCGQTGVSTRSIVRT